MATLAEPILDADVVEHRRGFWRRWYRTPSFVAGLSIILLIMMLASSPPSSPGTDPTEQDLLTRCRALRSSHPLGTDDLGRDVCRGSSTARASTCASPFLAVLFPFVIGRSIGLALGLLRRPGRHGRELARQRRRRVPVLRADHRARLRARAPGRATSTSRSRSSAGCRTRGSSAARCSSRSGASTCSRPGRPASRTRASSSATCCRT